MTPDELSRSFGQMVRARRQSIHMNQEDLATLAGVSRKYLVDLEAGKATAWLGPALLIAKTLGIEFTAKDDTPEDGLDDLPDMEL